jgi:hypothetical protein
MPSIFTLDKRLNIPYGFHYQLDIDSFRETHPINQAPSLRKLEQEIRERNQSIPYMAQKIAYYLGRYDYCHQYEQKELERLFSVIDKDVLLKQSVYKKQQDIALFKATVLCNAAPTPEYIG